MLFTIKKNIVPLLDKQIEDKNRFLPNFYAFFALMILKFTKVVWTSTVF